MKIYRHLLLTISLVIISFFSINNVSAADVVHVNIDYDSKIVSELISNLKEEIEIAEQLANHYKNTTRYSIIINNDRVKFILYETATTTQIRSYFNGGANNKLDGKPDNTSYKYVSIVNDEIHDLQAIINELDNSSYINTLYYSPFNSSLYIYGSSKPTSTFDLYEYSSTNYSSFMYNLAVIYDTNLDNIEIIETSNFLPISFNNGDILYAEDSFLTYKQVMNTSPSIKITKENEEITTIDKVDYISAVNMKIETNVIDDTKYICMLSTDRQDWDKYICSETYNYRMEKNGTLYVQIVDKDTEELISSATYTVSSIQALPFQGDMVKIYFQKITEKVDSTLYNQCTISQSLVNYRVCETVSISFDVINYNKYIYEMSLDGGNTWEDVSTRIYNNFYLERIFENKVIYIRVLNRNDYSYNNTSTYQITTIESASEYGQRVLFGSKYYTNRPDVDITALFLNYDSTTYNYYYSLYNTSDSFIDITDSISCTNNLCTFNTRIYVKGTMYVRIEDKFGNLVYSATYTVDYYNWMKTNSSFDEEDFFGSFFDSFDYFLNPIKEIFNSVTIFFDSLPIEIKYTFYVSFVIIIVLFLIKFVL